MLVFSAIFLCIVVLTSIYSGMVLEKMGWAHILKEVIQSKQGRQNYFRSFAAIPEHIDIDIKYKNFQKLAHKRKVALASGMLVTSSDDYVPARIHYKGKRVAVKLRLKGDRIDQIAGKKWSFRIVVKGDDTLFGMKAFSIHDPAARDYAYEWLLHKAMKRENVISLRYDFIDVTINGTHLGIYALEEHFEKRLIEDNHRKEGPIICFSEDAAVQFAGHFGFGSVGQAGAPLARIDLYRPTKTLENATLYKQFIFAKNLLESFRIGKLKTSDAFDAEILARYFAILDLFNARHAGNYGNLKIYYNPITSKLEPICFDAEYVANRNFASEGIYAENWYKDNLNLTHIYFRDNYMFELYMKELARISDPSYLDNLFNEIDTEMKEKLNILHKEHPELYIEKDIFYAKQLYIKKIFNIPVVINAYFKRYIEENGKKIIELDIGNITSIPVKIISITMPDGIKFPAEAAEKIIQPSFRDQSISIENVRFILPQNFEWGKDYINRLKVNYSLLGWKDLGSEKVIPWAHFDQDFIENDFIRQSPNVKDFDFLLMDDVSRKIYIKPGNWDLVKNLIIPKGYRVVCKEAVELNLLNSAKILSYSPLEFIGLEDGPIVIRSSDSTGQGVVVIDGEDKTILRYVIFDNLSNPSQGEWELTGAVTFYNSPVDIGYCQFLNNRSEDGLNVVRSGFLIYKSFFTKTFSDAFDSDFCKGEILDSSFVDCGNDAIDVSGSIVDLKNIFINYAKDKGVSVGEASNVTVNSIEIKNTKFAAMASKDTSQLNVDNAAVHNCKIGFAVYNKKPEFGPAFIKGTRITLDKVDMPYLVEGESGLTINGEEIKCDQNEVEKILDKYLQK